MAEQLAMSQPAAVSALENKPVTPLLYLSSTGAGWEGLDAQAFYEPRQLEDWITPERSTLSLMLLTGGAMRVEQRQAHEPWKTFSLQHGDLVLRPVGTSLELRKKSLSQTPTQTLHLSMRKNLLARTIEEVTGQDSAHLEFVEYFGFQDPLLEQLCLALWRELEQRTPMGKIYTQTTAQMLILHLLRYYTVSKQIIKDPHTRLMDQQMRRIVDFVQAHLDQKISLDALAAQTGFSPYHFARLFRQTTGSSPHQFVLSQRVERARLLLTEKEMSLAQIAAACGFADQSHLAQMFKRFVGLTPQAYRREHAL